MKKYGLLKVLGISFLVVAGLSWIIPAGSFMDGTFTKGNTLPVGLVDLVRIPLSTVFNLIYYGIIFLLIGGLYGVLNKTGVYAPLVDKLVKKFKNNEKLFLIITMVIFAVLSSATGLVYPLFILVPFFITVLLSMHYSKMTALMATIGAILVGLIGSTYGVNINDPINYYFSLDVHDEIVTKIIFLAIVTFLAIVFVLRSAKPSKSETHKKSKKEETKEEKIDIPLFTKGTKNKKSFWPLVIIMSLTMVLLLVGMFNWQYTFGIDFFANAYNSIMAIEVADYPLVQNLIGTINAMGNWGLYEMSIILIMVTLLIGWLYNFKLGELVDSFIKGAKEMLPTAFYVTIANIIFFMLVSSQSGENMFFTIANFFFEMSENLNIVTMSIVSAIGSFFYNDFSQLFNAMGGNIAIIYPDAEFYPVISVIARTMYGLVMLIAPTSLLLIGGLSYLDISFTEWFKYIWKFLLQVLAVAVLIIIIMLIFV